ncbi:MAG: TraX family protein [Eubacteriales bacterium]|nr:TraX family protein [Eubacteriales bacterium]
MTAQTVLSRVRTALLTPPAFPEGQPKIKANLDTNFLKLVAILSMLIDHIGGAFYPDIGWFRWVGRLAFPIFCYCMTVGLLYTRNVKKYLLRLGLFAVVSQPVYVLAFHPHDFLAEFTNWNIFFTLFLSLLAMYGLKERKWWLFVLAFFVVSWWNFDYSGMGIELMLIFYLCRNRPLLGAGLYLLLTVPPAFHAHAGDPLNLTLGGLTLDWTFSVAFAVLFIYIPTHFDLKIPKWFFYAFYPAHLAAIAIIQFVIS